MNADNWPAINLGVVIMVESSLASFLASLPWRLGDGPIPRLARRDRKSPHGRRTGSRHHKLLLQSVDCEALRASVTTGAAGDIQPAHAVIGPVGWSLPHGPGNHPADAEGIVAMPCAFISRTLTASIEGGRPVPGGGLVAGSCTMTFTAEATQGSASTREPASWIAASDMPFT
jgi:hypothetical protein